MCARFHYSQQEMPVLALTGTESNAKQAEVFHAGANDFVAKPIVEEVLMACIHSLLLIKQQFKALKRQTEYMHKPAIEALEPAGIAITVSIGLATNQQNPDLSLTQLLNRAAQGRNKVCA